MFTIRPSDVSSWALCPARVGYKDTQSEFPSYAMSRGTLLHARIEHHFVFSATKPSFDYRDAYAHIVEADTNGTVEVDDLPPKAVGALIGEVDTAWHSWKNDVFPQFAEYGADIIVEHRLERELVPRNVMMGGTPDLVIPDEKWIVDWKTAGRAWKATKAVGELQPPAYTWLNGWDSARFTFYVCDMSTFEWGQHTVWVEPDQVYAWVEVASDVALAMERGIYPATPSGQSWKGARGWHCSPLYCSAWNICEAKHLIADGQGTLVRDPRLEWNT